MFDPFVETMAEQVRVRAGRAQRADVARNIKNALSVILGNLFNTHLRDQNRYVIIDRSNDGYPAGNTNPLRINIRAVKDSFDFLVSSAPSYMEVRGGNYDMEAGRGYPTRVRSTRRLIEELEGFLYGREQYQEDNTRGIIRNTLTDNPQSFMVTSLFRNEPLPLIRLRGEKPARGTAPLLTYDPTDETARMEANLRAYNRFLLEDHWIDLLISDRDFQALSQDVDDERDEFGDEDDGRWELDLHGRNQLYRVFNNGRFTDGGRFYGGWWQGVPSRLRKHLTINWFPTAELDYSNMQIAMLYADQGLEMNGDAYQIEGIPADYRKLIKRTVFKIINADGQIRAPQRADLPEGWTWRQLLDAVREKHRPIAQYFGTGEGIRLQRRDADIAESVMLTMMREGHLVLPIHDSFVVENGRENRLREVMVDAYTRHIGHNIEIEDNEPLNLFPLEAWAQHEAEVRDIEDWIADVEEQDGYTNYRQRRTDFLRLKGERWGHEHHFHH
jgi:hypothetical protein